MDGIETEEELEQDLEAPEAQDDESIEAMVGRLVDEGADPNDSQGETENLPLYPQRDERGRFASKKVSEEGEAPTPEVEGQTPEADPAQAQEVETPLDPIPAPVSWPGESKAEFTRLPRDLQEVVAERERQRESFLHETRRKWSAVEELVSPYEQSWAQQGISFPQVLRQFFAYSDGLARDPINTGLQLMQQNGVTREQLLQAITQGQGGVQNGQLYQQGMGYDPRLNEVLNEVQTLKQQLASREQEQYSQVYEQTAQEIFNISQSVDESGQLKYPFFVEAKPVMDAIAPQLRQLYPDMPLAQFLDVVYRKATAGDPRVEKFNQTQAEQRRIAEAEKRVQASRSMGVSLKGSPAGKMTKQYADDDIESMVRAIADGEL